MSVIHPLRTFREREKTLRMRSISALALLTGLVACSDEAPKKPDAAAIDRLEQRLSADECIRPLQRWSRRYAYGFDPRTGGARTDTIHFLFQEAGKYEFREGRSVVTPDEFITIDDRPYRIATGTYTVASDQLELHSCGPNI